MDYGKRQIAYETVDNIFMSFVVNNQEILDAMDRDKINPIDMFLACTSDIMGYPFNVCFVGKLNGQEGPLYTFIDAGHNKIYEYYDVE